MRRKSSLFAGVALGSMVAFYGSAAAAQQTTTAEASQLPGASVDPIPASDASPSQDAAESNRSGGDLKDIIVTARRKALENATERKRNSDTIIDSIVADDAGKLPDNSITEVLQRVPGVSIVRFASLGDPDRFSIEGSGIQVRGLSNVLATLNGREIAGANGGGGISWGEVTPELMAAVDVYKASTADRIEGGIGGAVDLRTKMPFDFNKFSVAASLQGGYGDASKKASYGGSVLLTDTWETPIGKIGVLVDVAYNKLRSQSSFIRSSSDLPRVINNSAIQNQIRYVPAGIQYGQEQFERRRRGLYTAVQWEPASNLRFFQTVFISNYQSDRNEQSVFAEASYSTPTLFSSPSSDAIYDKNGILRKASLITPLQGTDFAQGSLTGSGTASNQENQTTDISQGFRWSPFDHLTVNGALQFINSFADANAMSSSIGSTLGSYSYDATGSLPNFKATPAISSRDRSSYQWQSFAFNPDRNRLHDTAINLDLVRSFDEGFLREVAVGGRYANRRERDNQIGTYWTPLGRGWNGSPQLTLADGRPGDADYVGFSDFFKGSIDVPTPLYVPSQALLGTYNPTLIQQLYGYDTAANPNGPNPIGKQDRYGLIQTRVRNYAAYAQARFKAEGPISFDGNIGVRLVRIDLNGNGNSIITYPTFYASQADADADFAAGNTNRAIQQANSSSVRAVDNRYTRVLPSFNLNFHPSSASVVRLAVTRTMSMPDFISTRATQTIGLTTATNANNSSSLNLPPVFLGYTADRGNPALKPTMSLNLDLSAEYYPNSSFNAHVALFRKILTDQILYGTTVRPYSQSFQRNDGTGVPLSSVVTTNEVYNADKKSFLTGVEIGGRKFFDFLPKPFDGLGLEANYTYIDSKSPSALARDINGNMMSGIPIVGLSRHNYNIQALYERQPFSVRVAYSWRSKYLQTTNGNGTTPTFTFVDAAGNSSVINASLPVYAAAYGQLDAGVTVSLTKNVRVSLQGTNLTNSVTKTLMAGYPGGALPVRSWFISDRRIEGGLNVSF